MPELRSVAGDFADCNHHYSDESEHSKTLYLDIHYAQHFRGYYNYGIKCVEKIFEEYHWRGERLQYNLNEEKCQENEIDLGNNVRVYFKRFTKNEVEENEKRVNRNNDHAERFDLAGF